MASSPTVQRCLPLPHNSPNSFKCAENISVHDEGAESEGEMRKSSKYRFNRGHALLRKQVQRHIVLHSQKTFGRRRFTFSGYSEHKVLCKKRRRFTSIALPTKFLLGGNITDPLNLRSLEDEKINQQLNAFTPASSPMPMSRHRTQVQVLIPPNIYDPLNLNTGEEIEFNLLASKPRKRRRHRKSRREENDCVREENDEMKQISQTEETQEYTLPYVTAAFTVLDECSENESKLDTYDPSSTSDDRTVSDKIVSPVVPQGSPAKFFKRFYSRSISKDADEKSSLHKQMLKHRRSKTRKVDTVKFRANAAKFCYGNHVTNHSNWNYGHDGNEDTRLRFFNKDSFYRKDILDIGCNTGEITLYIAQHWLPRKIVGLDIDKKLINVAQKNVRMHLSKEIADGYFPESMAAMYGPLAKVGISSLGSSFPKNVTFFEANYVPSCDEYLETQKPEFDIILCLRVTKWIHLNFGDEGLKLAFKRMYAQLRLGGQLILEPQPWFTYSGSKRITPAIYKTYRSLQMKPESFCDYLLSEEVGFSSCELIGRTFNCTKVYRQPVYIFTKGFPSCGSVQLDPLGPITFAFDEWDPRSQRLPMLPF